MASRDRRERGASERRRPVEVEDFDWVDTRSMPTVPGPAPALSRGETDAPPTDPGAREPSLPTTGGPGAGEAGEHGDDHRPIDGGRVPPRAPARTPPGDGLATKPARHRRAAATARDRVRARAGAAVGLRFGDALAAGSALALLVCMFATAWYGVAGVPDPSYARPALATTENGWSGLPLVRWVIVLSVLAAVGSLALHLSQRRHGVETETGRVVAALGALTSALLVWRVLISLPGGGKVLDQKLGALIGLACALGVTWGGAETVIAQRALNPRPAPGALALRLLGNAGRRSLRPAASAGPTVNEPPEGGQT